MLPDKVIIYRDGVGDGQMKMVAEYEVEQLRSCFSHFGADYNPKLSVVVVQKRINTRIMAQVKFTKSNIKFIELISLNTKITNLNKFKSKT